MSSSKPVIPLTIIPLPVPTGLHSIWVWSPATLSIPPVPTTYTVEGLRVIEVNPTELVVAGATETNPVKQTLYAGGAPITISSGVDWLPQTISLGEALYLGERRSTDTYPPRALQSATALTVAGAESTATPTTSVIPIVTKNPTIKTTTAPPLPALVGVSKLTPPEINTLVQSILIPTTTTATASITSTPTLVSLPSTTPFAALPPFPTALSNQSTTFATASGTITSGAGFNITAFQGSATSLQGENGSLGLIVLSLVLAMGLRSRLWG